MNEEYNKWAISRIDNVIYRTVDDWVEYDRLIAKRRESIRKSKKVLSFHEN